MRQAVPAPALIAARAATASRAQLGAVRAGVGRRSPTGLIAHLARCSVEDRKAWVDDLNARVGNRRVARMIAGADAGAPAPAARALQRIPVTVTPHSKLLEEAKEQLRKEQRLLEGLKRVAEDVIWAEAGGGTLHQQRPNRDIKSGLRIRDEVLLARIEESEERLRALNDQVRRLEAHPNPPRTRRPSPERTPRWRPRPSWPNPSEAPKPAATGGAPSTPSVQPPSGSPHAPSTVYEPPGPRPIVETAKPPATVKTSSSPSLHAPSGSPYAPKMVYEPPGPRPVVETPRVGGSPTSPGVGSGGAAKVEQTVVQAETKLAGRIAGRVGSIGLSLLLPGPIDALVLMWQFAGSYAAAHDAIRKRNLRDGFALGLSASLLLMPEQWVRGTLYKRFASNDVTTQMLGAVGMAEKARNEGLAAGYAFGEKLSRDQRVAFRDTGFGALAGKGLRIMDEELFTLAGVARLAGALFPSVDRIFDEARKSEELKRRLAAEKSRREDWSRAVGNKI